MKAEWKPPHVTPLPFPWGAVIPAAFGGWSLGNLFAEPWRTWIPVVALGLAVPHALYRLRQSKRALERSTEELKQAELRIWKYRDDEIEVMRNMLLFLAGLLRGAALQLNNEGRFADLPELASTLERASRGALIAAEMPSEQVRSESAN